MGSPPSSPSHPIFIFPLDRGTICPLCLALSPKHTANPNPDLNLNPITEETPLAIHPCLHHLGRGTPSRLCCVHACDCPAARPLVPLEETVVGYAKFASKGRLIPSIQMGVKRVRARMGSVQLQLQLGVSLPDVVVSVLGVGGKGKKGKGKGVSQDLGQWERQTQAQKGVPSVATTKVSISGTGFTFNRRDGGLVGGVDTPSVSDCGFMAANPISGDAHATAAAVAATIGDESSPMMFRLDEDENEADEDEAEDEDDGDDDTSPVGSEEVLALNQYHSFPPFEFNPQRHWCSIF
ncbi:hypothetical protein B0T16DRAFT_457840 [Cercophora newfieldiana]|uniref:Uncharacterized protein n=1 Tax=Cercophora newfieldiana TaxID=92897 RepID=A0AA39Y511_9PEZI|nr:hypothetical protein B0T16DRAFT_457840 [Cercophora newfieldiana]